MTLGGFVTRSLATWADQLLTNRKLPVLPSPSVLYQPPGMELGEIKSAFLGGDFGKGKEKGESLLLRDDGPCIVAA